MRGMLLRLVRAAAARGAEPIAVRISRPAAECASNSRTMRAFSTQQTSGQQPGAAGGPGNERRESAGEDGDAGKRDGETKPKAEAKAAQGWSVVRVFGQVVTAFREELPKILLTEDDVPLKRPSAPGEGSPAGGAEAGSALVVTKERPQKESAWRAYFGAFVGHVGAHPVFERLASIKESQFVKQTKQFQERVSERIQERWETSDSKWVHRLSSMHENLFKETEQATAMKEIMRIEPNFDTVGFLAAVRRDVPTVTRAYCEGDLPSLREYLTPENMERVAALARQVEAEGFVQHDPRVLDVGDVELVDVKIMDSGAEPYVVVRYTVQQVVCVKDRSGAVVEGKEDNICLVCYAWVMRRIAAPAEDGSAPGEPEWRIADLVMLFSQPMSV